MANKIAIITASTRTPRVGPNIAAWVLSILTPLASTTSTDISLHTVAVADFNLPLFNESVLPAMVPEKSTFAHAHSKAWSAEIAKYAGYIFVIPEYNYSLAAATKNAVDYLYNEWIGKPVLIVSYGIQGGKHASQHLSEILEAMKLKVLDAKVPLSFKDGLGPDAFQAMNEGGLGEGTVEEWNRGEGKESLVKGWQKLVAALSS